MKISNKTLAAGITALTILGTSAAVLANKDHGKRDGDCDSDSAKLVQDAAIKIDQAMKIALADMPGKIIEAEIEKDDGVVVWEIEIVNNQNQIYEYEIDANNGAILENKRDDD